MCQMRMSNSGSDHANIVDDNFVDEDGDYVGDEIHEDVTHDEADFSEDVNNSLITRLANSWDARELLQSQFQGFMHLYAITPQSFSNMLKLSFRASRFKGLDWLNDLLVSRNQHFYDAFRVDRHVFIMLCKKVLATGCFVQCQQTKVCLEECVSILLYTIGMHQRHHTVAEWFQRSPETISRHIHIVVDALCHTALDYIRAPNFDVVPHWIQKNTKLFPYFNVH